MQSILYALQFRGSAAPDASGVLKVKATAQSASIRTTVGSDLGAVIEPASGGAAEFESDVTMMGDTAFNETGAIRFGGAGSLRFSVVGRGTVGPAPQEGLNAGVAIWKVEGGDGKLSGVSGLITSNFFFNAAGEVTDSQVGVLYLPSTHCRSNHDESRPRLRPALL
jgi:hypothetical protein